jgi:predicted nuclease with TOPRIM domain
MARPLNDSPYLYGLHDPGGEQIMAQAGTPGWILFTEALGNDPGDQRGADYSGYANQGFGIIARLNNGYEPNGTIPFSNRYGEFAQRCANFVRNSRGCNIWIIGNETNYSVERPGVQLDRSANPPRIVNAGEVILPGLYANCYRQCRTAIKAVAGHQNDQVIIGGVAPWNDQTKYDGNPDGDWAKYLTDILTILGPSNCDGISIHAYTHGWDPKLIYSDAFMNPPFNKRQYNFRCYRDFMEAIPRTMRSLPVYLTEADQNDTWRNENVQWVQRAYGEIDWWNKQAGNQIIRAVILYRWPNVDKWGIDGKAGVIEDFKQAMTFKYNWETAQQGQPGEPVTPTPITPTPVTPTPVTPTPVTPTPVTPTPTTPDTSPIKFDITGKTAKGVFAAFYRQYGLDVTGYPITDEYTNLESNLKTQDWQRLTMEEFEGKVRLRLTGQEIVEAKRKVAELAAKTTALEQQVAQLKAGGAVIPGPAEPEITDITDQLPRDAARFVPRPISDIQAIVVNHTGVRPEVGADRVAQAQRARWPGIVGQYFITGDGKIQQTNPIDQVVARDQPYIYNGINLYVAGNFDETVPSEAQMDALARLVAWLRYKYNLPNTAVRGAGEYIVTRSPGLQWMQGQKWKDTLLARAAAVPPQPGAPAPVDSAELVILRQQVSELQLQVDDMQMQLASAQQDRADLQAQRDQFQARVAAVEQQLAGLQTRAAAAEQERDRLKVENEALRKAGGSTGTTGGPAQPEITDITASLSRDAAGFTRRNEADITGIVINHTGVRPEVGADRVAQAQRARWPGIVGQYFITGDGKIQQTNPINEVVARDQAWIYNGVNIYVAGNFDETVPSEAQMDALSRLVAWLLYRYKLQTSTVKGVSEYIVTHSPGLQWMQGQKWKDTLLARVAAVPSQPGTSTPTDTAALAALRQQLTQLQAQTTDLQARLTATEQQRAALQAQLDAALKSGGTGKLAKPAMTDISLQLPRNAGSLKKRTLDQIKYIVFNHTAVDPSVTAERIAAAHQQRWGAILYQYLITADGNILQTNALEDVVDLAQPWIGQGVNIAVAGNFASDVPTASQIKAAASLSAWLMQEYKIPTENVKGASEFIVTQSPGTQWLQGKKWKDTLLAAIAEAQKNAPSTGTGSPADAALLAALRGQVSQLQAALNQAQTKITALQQERDQLAAQLREQGDAGQLRQQVVTLTQQTQTLTQQTQTLTQQVQGLTNDKTGLAKQVQTLTGEKTTLSTQVQTLNGEKTSLTTQVQGLIKDKTTLGQQIQTLTTANANLTQQVNAASQEKLALNLKIADLEKRLADAQSGSGGTTPAGPRTLQPPAINDIVDKLPKHATLRYDTRTLDKITHIAIHHSAAPSNITPERIAAYHVGKDWPGMGYHFYVQPDGTINQCNRLETVSYQVYKQNAYSLGISIAGNFVGGEIPTPKQIEQVGHLVAWLMQKLNIPLANVKGHKEYPENQTSCPGSDWNTGKMWKKMIQDRVKEVQTGTGTGTGTPATGKTIAHYMLFWQRADNWAKEDFAAAANYFARFRPTAGFSPDDAKSAEYVTIVGGVAGVPYETEQMLIASGAKVERLAGVDFADTKRMLDELASSGKRFKTFNV